MFTRGSRLFFGLALAGYLSALVYGVITNGIDHGGVWHVLTGDGAMSALLGPITLGYKGGVGDHLGFTMLLGFAVTCAAMGFTTSAFRDGDPEAVAEVSRLDAAPAVTAPSDLSPWPIVASFAAVIMVVGLAVGSLLFYIGLAMAVIAAIEWTVKTWSEQATGDPEVNNVIRARLMHPLELPVAGVILIAIVVFCFSRILLGSSEEGSIVWAIVLGALILGVGASLGSSRRVRRGVIVTVLLLAGLVVIGLGILGAVRGERKFGEQASANSASAIRLGETSS